MTIKTYIDDIINFKYFCVNKLIESKKVMGLLLNKPDIDIENDNDLENITSTSVIDHAYIDSTMQTSGAMIFVESEMKNVTPTINRMYIYVQVVCNKKYMDLQGSGFHEKGNRRDNLARYIDLELSGSQDFGIGRFSLVGVNPAVVPDGYTSVMLTYVSDDFVRARSIQKGE